jgi:hypothetical protein
MTTLVRGARWVAAACLFVVGAPLALLLLILYLGAAVVIGLLLSVFFVMILGFVGPVSNPVQWLVAIPTVAGCVIIGAWPVEREARRPRAVPPRCRRHPRLGPADEP